MFKIIKAFCRLLSNYASPFVIASAIVAFFVPVAFGWVHGNVSSIILGVIMLSMGLTISTDDIRNLMKQPLHILLGAVAQYTIMPFVAFGLTKVFRKYDDGLYAPCADHDSAACAVACRH